MRHFYLGVVVFVYMLSYCARVLFRYGHKINSLSAFFAAIDTDRSDSISRSELRAACARLDIGLTPLQLDRLCETVDVNRDGGISYEEFEAWMHGSAGAED